jgi:hypothetical protein
MTSEHGRRRRYLEGCRCPDCREANRVYCADLRKRHANGGAVRPMAMPSLPPSQLAPAAPGRVEAAVAAELEGLVAAQARPGLAAVVVTLAKILDGRAVGAQPSAARVLARLLDELRKPVGVV